ncbi:aromatic ring-hydroxylating oxygenase subunit alpha [Mycolicibacterium komossense]|uniref:Aromatic ring-hydroxylating dioxygenase subunit alpha n=1 Tax=Mycolicibacterium komossense TaxID=1779 RepID=A0ABT3C7C6_9MYCO|nr:aromatic ring-hydroxylating dioxygenase subunit alpha [Mycolicibacterium komossense]MCV7225330.1 aromatic ring-hydroxylating dioxygenase subunit alpha [Mycolicibacterium komossense]
MNETTLAPEGSNAETSPDAPETPRRRSRPALESLEPGLASHYYTDPAVAQLEQQHIFDRTWQLVGHVTDLPNPGSRIVGTIGRKEVVVVRAEDGEIRAHLNTCRHRGTRLVAGPGEEKALRCPYHGWTYHLDGTLVGAPENRTIPCLDKTKLSLFPAQTEVLCGLIFVNLDPAATPLAPQLEGIRPLLERYLGDEGDEMEPFGAARIHLHDPRHIQNSNWKVAVDNYLEGYHVPVAHPGLMRLLDYKRYSVETNGIYAVYDAPLRDKPSDNWAERLYQRLIRPMPGLAEESDHRVFRYIAIYPNTVIDLYPDHVLLWKMNPCGVDRVGVPGTYLRRKDCDTRTRIAQRLNLHVGKVTNHEDEELVQRMQIGMGNTHFEPGPLSLREAGVAWFAGRIRADLGDVNTGPEQESGR